MFDLKIANSWWMYTLGVVVVVFVLAGCAFFIINAFKEAKKMNMDQKMLKKVVLNSAVFTILPSISILIGVVALSGTLGVPLPWIRLTVIGALHYEGAAAEAVFDAIGTSQVTAQVFVTIAFVMTLGILTGPLFCLFGFKAYDKKVLSKARNLDETLEAAEENQVQEQVENKPKKQRKFGAMLFDIVFIGMICAFLGIEIAKYFNPKKDYTGTMQESTYYPIVAIVVAFGAMALCDFLEKKLKQKWISNFSLGFSMILGMLAAVIAGLIG